MSTDILFIAKNRWQFTEAALDALIASTNWKLVSTCHLWDDGSTDGAEDMLLEAGSAISKLCEVSFNRGPGGAGGSPAGAMNKYVQMPTAAEWFAKIDNDVIVPPGWLDACVGTVDAHPELDLLGIEPPLSRTPHYPDGKTTPAPELVGKIVKNGFSHGYAPCQSIGGIGLMRTKAFRDNDPLLPHSIFGGFTEWQITHPRVVKGWIAPPLKVFLLDRLPVRPWKTFAEEYERKGWQRAWSDYSPSSHELWDWWTTASAGSSPSCRKTE